MKISVIIPAYNSAAFIGDALASIQHQTHPVDEIIVVDDGSTDDTASAVEATGQEVIYLRQENQGPSAARNLGIRKASGNWIAFLDADDQWTPLKIEEQIATLEEYPELRLVASDMAEIDARGNTITESVLDKHRLLERFRELAGGPVPNALAALMEKNFIPTGTVLAHRESLVETGLFNPEIRFGEDLELWAKVASRHPIGCLPRVHMLRRQHGANATENTIPMLEDLVKVTRSVRTATNDILKSQGVDPDRLVAEALWNLGYHLFTLGDYADARSAFWDSLREHPSRRAFLYHLACRLPRPLIRHLRHIKQNLSGH